MTRATKGAATKRPRGRPWPPDYEPLVPVRVRVPRLLLERVQRTAEADETTTSDVIRTLLETHPGLER